MGKYLTGEAESQLVKGLACSSREDGNLRTCGNLDLYMSQHVRYLAIPHTLTHVISALFL